MYRVWRRCAALTGWLIIILTGGGALCAVLSATSDTAMGCLILDGYTVINMLPFWIIFRLFAWVCKPAPQQIVYRRREVDVLDQFRER